MSQLNNHLQETVVENPAPPPKMGWGSTFLAKIKKGLGWTSRNLKKIIGIACGFAGLGCLGWTVFILLNAYPILGTVIILYCLASLLCTIAIDFSEAH